MSYTRALWLMTVSITLSHLASAQLAPSTLSKRDTQAIEILARAEQAAGGMQALASSHYIRETGEITLCRGKEDEQLEGPVTIQLSGGSHFRMDADFPEGKWTWIVKDGGGSKEEDGRIIPIFHKAAINLGDLTYPLGYIAPALADSATDVSFIDVEKLNGRAVYRLQLKGGLGLTSQPKSRDTIIKDLLVDVLNFDILAVEDRPFEAHRPGMTPDSPTRTVEFSDFRQVHGIRFAFSIRTKLLGHQVLDIRLNEVELNTSPSQNAFQIHW